MKSSPRTRTRIRRPGPAERHVELQRALEPLEARYLLTTYYVSPGGSDAHAGTSDAAAFATLQHAADQVKAGDTVVVRAGTYAAGFALGYNAPQSGTAAAPIRF